METYGYWKCYTSGIGKFHPCKSLGEAESKVKKVIEAENSSGPSRWEVLRKVAFGTKHSHALYVAEYAQRQKEK